MRFLDKGDGNEKVNLALTTLIHNADKHLKVSQSILEVGVQKAIKQVVWDQETFGERGGVYDWSKPDEKTSGCGGGTVDPKLDW